MHAQLGRVAEQVVGADIDGEAISYAAQYGYEIKHANCEDMDLGQRFDLIVMSDVIEHVERPVQALINLVRRHLKPGGKLVVTTPNATFIGGLLDANFSRTVDVYWDHMAIYLPEHIQAICDRHGLKLVETQFFSFIDRRCLSNRIKTSIIFLFAKISPRLHNSFSVVIQDGDAQTHGLQES